MVIFCLNRKFCVLELVQNKFAQMEIVPAFQDFELQLQNSLLPLV